MAATRLVAGTAEVTITPPIGAPLLGPTAPATGVHDDLKARVLVLADGAGAAVLVSLDLVGMDFALVDEMRAEVRRQTGADGVVLLTTHTHSAPFTIPWSLAGREWLATAPGLAWTAALVAAVGQAANEAAARLVPVLLRAGRAPVQVGMNRRVLTDAGVAMAPNPAGLVIPWVDVLAVDRADGAGMLAVLFAHAAHPVIVHGASSLISADYPGAACAALQRTLGPEVMPLFAQACGANINGTPLRGGHEEAELAGAQLATAVLQALAEAAPVATAPLRVAEVQVALPLQGLPPAAECALWLQQAQERLAQAQQETDEAGALWAARDDVLCYQDLLEKAERGVAESLRFGASAIAIGDAWVLLALTHEVFAEYQCWAESHSRWTRTMVAAYTNGCESYIPTDQALAEGGYEGTSTPAPGAALRYPYRAAVARGVEERVRGAIGALMEQVQQ